MHGSELMRPGRGNSRKELIEELRLGMAGVPPSGQVCCYQTACSLSADRHNRCQLFDTVCHFHVWLCRTIILNSQLIPDLSIRQIAFIPGAQAEVCTCCFSVNSNASMYTRSKCKLGQDQGICHNLSLNAVVLQ